MRILHIGKYFAPFRGGVESYLQDVLRAGGAEDLQSVALVHQHQRGWHSSTEQHEADNGTYTVVRSATWMQAFFTPISPGFRGHLSNLIDEFKPDVIHAHLPNPSACWWLTLRKAREIPLVIHWHSDVITASQGFLMRLLYGLYRPLERRLLKASAAILATSPSYLRSSRSLQEFPEKCHVVPLGLDPRRIEQYARQSNGDELKAGGSREPGNFQILGIGRLTYYKGFGYLIRALAELPGVELHIVGEGSLRRELRLLAKQMKVVKRVHFHGGLDDRQLAARLEACDCLCLPSIERTEAFGLVLLEAKIFAKATVVSDVRGSGMAWVVEDGVTGVTVPPKDVPALVQALAKLRDDPELTRTLGLAGRARFEERFTIACSVRALAEVYRGVHARRSPS